MWAEKFLATNHIFLLSQSLLWNVFNGVIFMYRDCEEKMTYRKDDFSIKVDKAVLLRLHENAHDIGTVEHLQI